MLRQQKGRLKRELFSDDPLRQKSTLRVNRFQSTQGVSVGCACVQGNGGRQRAGDFAFSRARFGGCGGMYADAAFATGSDGDGDDKVYAPPLIAQASSLAPLQSIVVSELAKSRGKLTNKVYRKSDIWR